jgi:hypothetical protein
VESTKAGVPIQFPISWPTEHPAWGIGAKVVAHARYIALQMAEVAISKNLFAESLRIIAWLRPALAASIG